MLQQTKPTIVFFILLSLLCGGALATPSHGTAQETPAPEASSKLDLLWVQAEVGYSWLLMARLGKDNFLTEEQEKLYDGWAFGGAAGLKFLGFLRVGGKSTVAKYSEFDVVTAALDLELRPESMVAPYLRLGVGYAWFINEDFRGNLDNLDNPEINGFLGEVGLGLDVNFSEWVSFGVGADIAFMNLNRKPFSFDPNDADDVDLAEDGTALSLQARAMGNLTLKF